MEHTNRPLAASKRAFLGSPAAASAALTLGATPATAGKRNNETKVYRELDRVDLHAHALPPVYRQALADAGMATFGGFPIPPWSPDLARTFMDKHGIAVQVLSVSEPGVSFLPVDQQPGLAAACNDSLAEIVRADPQHFAALGMLPLEDVEASRAEVARSLDDLRLDGITVLSSARGRYLGDPAFDALLSDLDDRRAWVFVHPAGVSADNKPAYSVPDFVAEYPFDTTRTIVSLLVNGVFEKYPKIRWHFAHGGGTAPMLRLRLNLLCALPKPFAASLGLPAAFGSVDADAAMRALGASYYDTALVADMPALELLKATVGPSQLLFGSDWPFASMLYKDDVQDPQPALSETFSCGERRLIDRQNAREQFPRVASVVGDKPKD